MIFLFLRDWRTTLIPVLVIPVSLIGAFFVMYVAGFSINVLTLLALVLAIGLVVDDAIVVLENVYAKIEAGMAPVEAGVVGTREIFFAVIATTVALVAVLLPIFFLGGLTGRLFREFGATLAGAVIISSFVALTLTLDAHAPGCSRSAPRQPWLYRATEPFFRWLTGAYRGQPGQLPRPAAGWRCRSSSPVWRRSRLFGRLLPAELAPLEDRSRVAVSFKAPEGATYEYMDRYVQAVTEMMHGRLSRAPRADDGDLARLRRLDLGQLGLRAALAGRPGGARAQPDGGRRRSAPAARRLSRAPAPSSPRIRPSRSAGGAASRCSSCSRRRPSSGCKSACRPFSSGPSARRR